MTMTDELKEKKSPEFEKQLEKLEKSASVY